MNRKNNVCTLNILDKPIDVFQRRHFEHQVFSRFSFFKKSLFKIILVIILYFRSFRNAEENFADAILVALQVLHDTGGKPPNQNLWTPDVL